MKSAYMCKDVASRVKYELDKRGLKPSPTMKKIGLGENTLRNFQTSMPKADTLAVIADYLNVSVDYLLGRHTAVQASAPANPKVNKLISMFEQLTPEQQDGILTMLEGFTIPNAHTGTDLV